MHLSLIHIFSCELFGSGHINTTYLAKFDDKGSEWKYVVQKINPNVFKDIDQLMAVSYTHLDVYKRQGQAERRLCAVHTQIQYGQAAVPAFLF